MTNIANELEKALKGTHTLAIAKASGDAKAKINKPKRPTNGDDKAMKVYHKAMRTWMETHGIERKQKSNKDNDVVKRIRSIGIRL